MLYIYKKEFHSDAYFIALLLMAGSLPLSKFAMSVMQFTLLGLWLWSGFSFLISFGIYKKHNPFIATAKFLAYLWKLTLKNLSEKFTAFFKNKAALVLVSLFFLHLLGLLYTSDFAYAFKDLRIKLPLLAFPIILSTMEPIGSKRFNYIMLFHAAAVLIGTFFSVNELLKAEFTDIRKISIFISPIRFSLNICIAIFTLLYFSFKKDQYNVLFKLVFLITALWLIIFLVILESGIGVIIFLSISFILLLSFILTHKNLYLKIVFSTIIILTPIIIVTYLNNLVKEFNTVEKVDFKSLDKYTESGNRYKHDTIWLGVEDGKYVGQYLQWQEAEKAWNERSKFDFNGKDKNGQKIKFTLVRYLTSKGLRKDSVGVYSLTEEDIRAIERGIANVNYLKSPSLKTRLSKVMIGYHNFKYDHDPNGSSILQRIEYWKASLGLICENFWLGVGTGDVEDEFNQYYEETNSQLHMSNRWRSHNQYLSVFVTFGVFGLLWFIFTLIYPPIKQRTLFEYFYLVYFITIVISMFTEDTIESQAGVTLFAFFSSFLLFSRKED